MKNLVVKVWNPTDPIGFIFKPDLPHNFSKWIDIDVGYEDEKISATFSVQVCSFTWLAHHYSIEGPRWGRHLLVVGQYDAEEIKLAIETQINACSRETWEESIEMLSRYFAWEFEDYRP